MLNTISKQQLVELYHLYQTSTTTNTTAAVNVTHKSIADTFPQYVENVASITNSCVFIVAYIVVMTILTVILIKYRKEMKRNQVYVFTLVFWCILQQTIGLIFRLAYNGTALTLNLNFPDYTKITNLSQYIQALTVFSAIESLTVYMQGVVIVVITCFILNIL